MEIRKINDTIAVSPQVLTTDVAAIKAAGFRTVICNRPDGEVFDQPFWKDVETEARKAGLETCFIPITAGAVSDRDIADFGAALRDLPGPVFAYCRSGTRSAMLWALSQANVLSVGEILGATKAAGYDMGGLADRLASGA